tara:strand:+ start:486 stop:740 length:255 start_codon:yes stop_codon:yes gene_type:complete
MNTLNLNKIILLTTLFLVAIAFSNSANALCVVNGAGAIVIADDGSGNSTAPVKGEPHFMILKEMWTIRRTPQPLIAESHPIHIS